MLVRVAAEAGFKAAELEGLDGLLKALRTIGQREPRGPLSPA